jgi:hypothetical protein
MKILKTTEFLAYFTAKSFSSKNLNEENLHDSDIIYRC